MKKMLLIILAAVTVVNTSLYSGGIPAKMVRYDVVWRFQDLQEKANKAKQALEARNQKKIESMDKLGAVLGDAYTSGVIDFLKDWARSGKVYEVRRGYGDFPEGLNLKETSCLGLLKEAGFVAVTQKGNSTAVIELKTYEKTILYLYGCLY